MRKILIITLLSLFYTQILAQYSLKFGKITEDELKMKVYSEDSSAVAVFIYEDVYFTYKYTLKDFVIETKYSAKIKVLKQEGTEYGNFEIPLYVDKDNKEIASGIEAYAYNLENGKVVKTKTDRQFIFAENVSSNLTLIKVSIQGVKQGSVIEYKYSTTSPYSYNIPSFLTQHNIPVIQGKYNADIPEYFVFQYRLNGFEFFDAEENRKSYSFNILNDRVYETVTCMNRNIIFKTNDMPALKKEPMVWCMKDYRSSVDFQLSGTNFPYSPFKPYSIDWGSLEKTLDENPKFGAHLKMTFPNSEDISKIILSKESETDKISKVLQFVYNNIAWDGTYAVKCEDPIKAFKEKTGNSAQINFVLISIIKALGYKAYPVLISKRENGRLRDRYPSIDYLNYFLVAVETSSGKLLFIDGTNRHSSINVFNTNYLTKGFIMNNKDDNNWVELEKLTKSSIKTDYLISFTSDMDLIGKVKRVSTNQIAFEKKNNYKNKSDYIKSIESNFDLIIDSININGIDSYGSTVEETFNFKKKCMKSDSLVYLNPIIFPYLVSNPFTESTRKLPIEFSFPFVNTQFITIKIPDNYTIEEIPKSARFSLTGYGMEFSYVVQKRDDSIVIMYTFSQNEIVYYKNQYQSIKEFFTNVADKNSDRIVLKKKS